MGLRRSVSASAVRIAAPVSVDALIGAFCCMGRLYTSSYWHAIEKVLVITGILYYHASMNSTEKPSGKVRSGQARMERLSREERRNLASVAAKARWEKAKSQSLEENTGIDSPRENGGMPVARYPGLLTLNGVEIPVYVLSNGQRVIARIAATEILTGVKRQGDLESYVRGSALQPFINTDSVISRLVAFSLPDVERLNTEVKGLPSDLFIEICQGYVAALNAAREENSTVTLTERQTEIAIRASMFLAACAKVGLDALIDEATGYQYERASDALQVKLRLYLAEEMRKWEKTFPDQLWAQFGRLTNWKGPIHSRPKYWGNLVMEIIYEHLDADVAEWLRLNAPKPMKGQNYHQWLSERILRCIQYRPHHCDRPAMH